MTQRHSVNYRSFGCVCVATCSTMVPAHVPESIRLAECATCFQSVMSAVTSHAKPRAGAVCAANLHRLCAGSYIKSTL